ncbi:MAG: HAD hydrolase family protein [Crocinitomicaceae bacterium]|jgi:3-deoxy-D-manno-octulosonate 8-phosphate phosphatase (KDO 8-P phosphatase)|nr:HAD hydrolase family protein [Crocinitomicaceae bacterium]MDP4760939.1 HAD hydrolase family protein [Crocinitomicaceae bacterium]
MSSYKHALNHITTFIFDVDGVFTDGKVYLLKDEIVRALNSKDGYAVQYASKMGYKLFAITGGNSTEVRNRLLGLGMEKVFLSAHKKIDIYEEIKRNYQLTDQEIAYMGDDIPDIPVLKIAGLSTCPQDAVSDVKQIVAYQSPYDGGKACVRDIIEQTLRVQGKWMSDAAFEW